MPVKQKFVPFDKQSLFSSSGDGFENETRGGVPLILGCLMPNSDEKSRSSCGRCSARGREDKRAADNEKKAKQSEAMRLGFSVTAIAKTWPDDNVMRFDERGEMFRSRRTSGERGACICRLALHKGQARQDPA